MEDLTLSGSREAQFLFGDFLDAFERKEGNLESLKHLHFFTEAEDLFLQLSCFIPHADGLDLMPDVEAQQDKM